MHVRFLFLYVLFGFSLLAYLAVVDVNDLPAVSLQNGSASLSKVAIQQEGGEVRPGDGGTS